MVDGKKIAIIKSQNYKHARSSGISEDIARKLAFAPHINIGVFSLEKDSSVGVSGKKFKENFS